MPRRDFPVQLTQILSYSERMLLSYLVQELNSLRQDLGLPQRTAEEVRQAFRQYLRATPRHAPEASAPAAGGA